MLRIFPGQVSKLPMNEVKDFWWVQYLLFNPKVSEPQGNHSQHRNLFT